MFGTKVAIRPEGYIGIEELMKKLGVGKSSAWQLVKECKNFPLTIKFGARRTMWKESEVDEWLMARIDEATKAAERRRKAS